MTGNIAPVGLEKKVAGFLPDEATIQAMTLSLMLTGNFHLYRSEYIQ